METNTKDLNQTLRMVFYISNEHISYIDQDGLKDFLYYVVISISDLEEQEEYIDYIVRFITNKLRNLIGTDETLKDLKIFCNTLYCYELDDSTMCNRHDLDIIDTEPNTKDEKIIETMSKRLSKKKDKKEHIRMLIVLCPLLIDDLYNHLVNEIGHYVLKPLEFLEF